MAESMCKAQPHVLVLLDPYHGRGRQQGIAPELIRLLHGFPSVTVVAALGPRPGWMQDVRALGEKGVTEVIDLSQEDTAKAVHQRLLDARGRPLRTLLQRGVRVDLPSRGKMILDAAVETASTGRGVRDLACTLGLSKATLLRWCADSGLPTPRRLLIWLRVLTAAELLDDPSRSVLGVAFSCGYSSDRALRRALRSTVRCAPSELRRAGAFRMVAGQFTGLLTRTASRSCQASGSLLPAQQVQRLYRGPLRDHQRERSLPRAEAPGEGPSA